MLVENRDHKVVGSKSRGGIRPRRVVDFGAGGGSSSVCSVVLGEAALSTATRVASAACYLFDAQQLLQRQITRGVKVGVAASVPAAEWNAAELYPSNRGGLLDLEPEQVALLRLFGD